ncbi:MAG: pyridoxamine 5'-phosphate oxidase family protein [Chloroflexota bacterium]
MAKQFEALDPSHLEFIGKQHMFFVGSAGVEGFVNVSPKGLDTLRIVDPTTAIWLSLTGSGNETAAHVLENGRMTMMFCSFDKQPLILRLYGTANVIYPRDADWNEHYALFDDFVGARQIYVLKIKLVQTSCGFAVPYYEFKDERPTLTRWDDQRGEAGVHECWTAKNQVSLDGKPTGILED